MSGGRVLAHSIYTCYVQLTRIGSAVATILLVLASFSIALGVVTDQAAGQNLLHFPPRTTPPKAPSPPSDAPMLLQATEIKYDYTNNTVAAVGNVQIYYGGNTVEADEVIYDQKTKRLVAKGNVRLTEPEGKITYGQVIDLTDDYRDGFVDSLRLETVDDTRFAASRADRSKGNYTVLQNGVYTACEPCKDDPKKPPLWQVKAARIIHDEGEKMLYFEDARLEFFGVPLGYSPFMSAPDPTVKRKSGVLFPTISYQTAYGAGIEIPYFFALAPNYDLTVTPMITTRQGPLLEGEWRQRLMDGSYSIKAAGIFQQDPNFFATRDGIPSGTGSAQNFRGVVQTAGQFALTDKWVWGWDGILVTDPTFLYDYRLGAFSTSLDPFRTGVASEGVSQLYLAGRGERSYFDVRSIYYYGFSEADVQAQLPIIHPVLDYSNTLGQQILGGELSYKVNLTSLTRQSASFDAISQAAESGGLCNNTATADSKVLIPANCLLRGIPGTYSRVSGEADWRRTLVTNSGMVITPFAHARVDAAAVEVNNQPGVSNYISTGDSELFRVMPTVGVEYHYPFVNVQSWGTQTIEPIAQLILRPDETQIGKFPNEDAQSLIFDDGNLFKVDKFSGWDRAEGGSRLNAGIQYTAQINRAGFFNVLFGQSYQLFGTNSFAVGDITNTGLGSGLDTTVSDYVARVSYQPTSIFLLTSRARFDEATFAVRRFEVEGRTTFDRWTLQMLYGNYAPQPQLGFLTRRQGILGGAQVKLTQNWILLGSARYDLYANEFDQTRLGVGYVDDCMLLSVNWLTGYSYNGTPNPTKSNTFMMQLSLRTLGADAIAPVGASF
jgi:LPS-assembly protein